MNRFGILLQISLFGNPAIMSRLGFRPVALRTHLSMGLPLSDVNILIIAALIHNKPKVPISRNAAFRDTKHLFQDKKGS